MQKQLCFVLNFFLIVSLFSNDLNSMLQKKVQINYIEPLLAEKIVQRIDLQQKDWNSKLITEDINFEKISALNFSSYPYKFELLSLYEKIPQKRSNNISSIITSISTLEGIEYFSHTRNKNRILYEKSYIIDSQRKKNKLKDPIVQNLDNLSLLALQKDSVFGENIYEYSYFEQDSKLGFFCTNLTSLSYGIIKIAKSEDLNIIFIVDDLDTHLLVYALFALDINPVPLLEKKITNSFLARMETLYTWFINQYEQ